MTTATKPMHTPGPWTTDRDNPDRIYGQGEALRVDVTSGRYEADAKLIAAAPDMLEALEAIANDCGLLCGHCSLVNDTANLRNYADMQRVADSAIRKARGL